MTDIADQVRIKARVTADHKIVADAPEDMAPGDVEIIVERPQRPSLERLKQLLKRVEADLKAGRLPGRTKEEIDAELQEERDAWDERIDHLRDQRCSSSSTLASSYTESKTKV